MRLAQGTHDPTLLLWAHVALWFSLFRLGGLSSARTHFEQALILYDPRYHRSYGFVYDPGVNGLAVLANVLHALGYPDQALMKSQEALALAQTLAHPFSLADALLFAARLHRHRRERRLTQERVEALIALSTEQGFSFHMPRGTILQGWALAEQGQNEEGIARIHQGLAALHTTGAEGERLYFLSLLAETYEQAGQAAEGLAAVAEALAHVQTSGDCREEAELYRLKGELLLKCKVQSATSKVQKSVESGARSLESEAEECFQKAIEVACHQSAKSWELRAVMSLSRLWQQQSKTEEARQILADIYNWFTEGFDTTDLQEAKALLAELASS